MRIGAWLWAKIMIVLLAIADIIARWQFTDLLITRRPMSPQGVFVVPFEQHGGVTYVTAVDNWTNIALIAGGGAVVVAWWLASHFEKRPKTR